MLSAGKAVVYPATWNMNCYRGRRIKDGIVTDKYTAVGKNGPSISIVFVPIL